MNFNKTVKGSSHWVSGKPCQDYSLCKCTTDLSVLIVCDGHGGDTYVRSDIGAKLAAKIAYEKIGEFIKEVSPELFFDKKGSLTVLPNDTNLVNLEYSNLTESQQEIVCQIKSYVETEEKVKDQQIKFKELFESIYNTWLAYISNDANQNPFTVIEKNALGNNKIQKAYGTTLIAYVQTPLYWFAFQIGDGTLLVCDRECKWVEPIPKDCNCFLNLTTSLCDVDPISEFRFAFDGTGDFPSAVILSSDGVDDTFVNFDNLSNFYLKLIEVFSKSDDKDKTLDDLEKKMKELSEKGSHDDMSISAIINIEELHDGLELKKITTEGSKLRSEKLEKEKEISDLRIQVEKLKSDVEKINGEISIIKSRIDEKEKERKLWEPESKLRYEEISKQRELFLRKIDDDKKKSRDKYNDRRKEYNTNSLLASSFNENEDDLKRVQARFYIRWLKIS